MTRPIAVVVARARITVLIVGALVVGGCSGGSDLAAGRDRAPQETAMRSAVAAAITPALVQSLGANGQVPLPEVEDIGRPQLTADVAQTLAVSWINSYSRSLRAALEHYRGSTIDMDRLHICGTPLYVRTVAEPASLPGDENRTLRNRVGPHWLVVLCDPTEPAVSLSIAALAVEMAGQQPRGISAGADVFYAQGIPADWSGAVPVSAEDAVVAAARYAGGKAAAWPQLVGADPTFIPQAAQWRVPVVKPDGTPDAVLVGMTLNPSGGSARSINGAGDGRPLLLTTQMLAAASRSGGGVAPQFRGGVIGARSVAAAYQCCGNSRAIR